MKKQLKIIFLSFFYIGLFISLMTLVMPLVLPDYVSGFLSGVSTSFISIGIAYMGWCLGKKENPYKLDD